MIGAFVWGLVGDKYGRMYAFKSTVCISTFFALMLTVSVHPGMSGVALVFLGFGIGGELSLGGTVFCEFCPPSKAYYLTVLAVFWGLGGTVSALVAFITVMTNTTSIYDWRYIVGSSFVIEVGCLIFRFFMEETPAFSILSGQVEKTEKILNNISIQNTGKEFFLDNQVKAVNKESVYSQVGEVGTKSSKEIIKRLFSGSNLKLVIVFGVVFFI
jgi:MFS family permease